MSQNGAIAQARRNHDVLAVLYFDLNGFKKINDVYGHAIGDEMLRHVAANVNDVLRQCDTIARLGGDEFVVLCASLNSAAQARAIAQKIEHAAHQPLEIEGNRLQVGISVGIATFPECQTVNELLRFSDLAMYEAKHRAKNPVVFWTGALEQQHQRQLEIERALPKALQSSEFQILFQPLIKTQTGQCVGVEALSRWYSKELGTVSPEDFIPVAETSDLAEHLLALVVTRTADLLGEIGHRQHSPHAALQKIALNISARQLQRSGFADRLTKQLKQLGIPPSRLSLEITERQIIENLARCRSQLEQLSALGVQISLDDYGTGYSSITHLKQLQMISTLKIDRSLISFIDQNSQNQALTAGIIEMGRRLGISIVAEGVERKEEWEVLRALNCDYFQGFCVAPALPASALLDDWNQWTPNA